MHCIYDLSVENYRHLYLYVGIYCIHVLYHHMSEFMDKHNLYASLAQVPTVIHCKAYF
jgi:hypothetical protein